MFDKIKKNEDKLIQKQAEEKAKVIDTVCLKTIALAVEAKLSVNDFEVVLQQCLNGIKNVYLSHMVSEFVDAPEPATEEKPIDSASEEKPIDSASEEKPIEESAV